MKQKTSLIFIVAVIAILAVITSCNKEPSTNEPVKTQTIKIGWMGPQTGQSAVLGMDSAVAAQIAVDEINAAGGVNGQKLELIIEDDQYNIAKAVTSYAKLVDIDRAKIIIANTYGSVFALSDKAQKDGVILIDPLDCNSVLAGLNDNVFCLATDSESIGQVLSEHAIKSGTKKIGIIYWNSDTFMPLVKDVFKEEFEKAGGQTFIEAYSAGTSDFKTIIGKMQQQKVEALVLLGYDETGIAMKQARELGFKGLFYTTGTVTSPPLQEAAAGNAEGTILAFWDAPKDQEPTKSFTQKFIEIKSRPPIFDLATYPTYDAVKAIAEALKNSKTQDFESVKNALLGIQGMKGVTGDVSFMSDGSVRIRESAHVLTKGVPVLVQ